MSMKKKCIDSINNLIKLVEELRVKCPWDREQTFDTLRNLTIEETFELSEGIILNDNEQIKNELGDILLHIIFYSIIASENNFFNLYDVSESISKKLINRHPHVFDNKKINNSDDLKRNWEEIKLKEGNKSVLSGVPKGLPPIFKAIRIQDKVSSIGFDWTNLSDVKKKVNEELLELQTEINKNNKEKIEDEYGDLLFSLINYARFIKIDPSKSLEKTNIKFMNRFNFMEKNISSKGKKINDLSINELDLLWEKSKKFF
tara:strand:- start:4189 stop:4965 length:777 start_codon:yes stop_codon:yes gene_type:complete